MMVFKRRKSNPQSCDVFNGAGFNPPTMSADVYQRNGVQYRPPSQRRASPAVVNRPVVTSIMPPTAIATPYPYMRGNHDNGENPHAQLNSQSINTSRPRLAPEQYSRTGNVRWDIPVAAPGPEVTAIAPGPSQTNVVSDGAPAAAAATASSGPEVTETSGSDGSGGGGSGVSGGGDETDQPAESNGAATAPNRRPHRSFLHSINPFSRTQKHRSRKILLQIYTRAEHQIQWRPGEQIRVLTPDQSLVYATIPPYSQWITKRSNGRLSDPYFQVEFEPDDTTATNANAPCTCVAELGVFDTTCPRHGNGNSPQQVNEARPEGRGGSRRSKRHAETFVVRLPPQPQTAISTAAQTEQTIPVVQTQQASTPAGPTGPAQNMGFGWKCKSCERINPSEREACDVCGIRKHGVVTVHEMPQPDSAHVLPDTRSGNQGPWECYSCLTMNIAHMCRVCGTRKPRVVREQEMLPATLHHVWTEPSKEKKLPA